MSFMMCWGNIIYTKTLELSRYFIYKTNKQQLKQRFYCMPPRGHPWNKGSTACPQGVIHETGVPLHAPEGSSMTQRFHCMTPSGYPWNKGSTACPRVVIHLAKATKGANSHLSYEKFDGKDTVQLLPGQKMSVYWWAVLYIWDTQIIWYYFYQNHFLDEEAIK